MIAVVPPSATLLYPVEIGRNEHVPVELREYNRRVRRYIKDAAR